jgi:glutamate/tyrosine decarboxylase-like PLP-dependent enzyme
MTAMNAANPGIAAAFHDENQQKGLYAQAAAYAYAFLDSLQSRRVFPDDSALAQLAGFDEALPEQPQSGAQVLAQLHELGTPAVVAHGGGRYFGFVNGGAIPTSLAARWMADVWDQNAALYVMSPLAAKLEQVCERWLVELCGLPPGSAAGLVSGTSVATLCGILAGRNSLLQKLGWDATQRGLFGAPPLRVLMSAQAHATVRKALAVLGIGSEQIEWLESDSQGRVIMDRMPPLDERTLLILQAGNVNTGAFDFFEPICHEARAKGAWVHVDGAFGLWAAASAATRHLTRGAELADSWSVDAHKTLNAPYDCGVILCRDRGALVGALQASGAYTQFSDERDGMLYGLEMSRRARGIELWALLKRLGRAGVDEMIAQFHTYAQLFASELRAQGFRILNDVVFNQTLAACETPELTQRTLRHIQRSGECWCGGSTWNGEPVIRISVCSWATTEADVRRSVAAFAAARAAAMTEAD